MVVPTPSCFVLLSLIFSNECLFQEAKEEGLHHAGKGDKHVHVEEESPSRRGSIQRKLTMKYDMHALKTLQEYEETLEPELLALYNLTSAVSHVAPYFP